ncbi:hypothetical protein TNCV_949321 [Trichonephila clavipes]|nr:hypothetical protein TNCV_949321 [Trichonephila clavipes]
MRCTPTPSLIGQIKQSTLTPLPVTHIRPFLRNHFIKYPASERKDVTHQKDFIETCTTTDARNNNHKSSSKPNSDAAWNSLGSGRFLDRVVVYRASTPQVWGCINGLDKVDSAFYPRYIRSINEYQACLES